MGTKLTTVLVIMTVTLRAYADEDNPYSETLCEMFGGVCRASCDREIRHQWDFNLCGEERSCCAHRPATPATPTRHGSLTVEPNECARNGGSCYTWYHFKTSCPIGTPSGYACDHIWASCCITSSDESQVASTTQRSSNRVQQIATHEPTGCGHMGTLRRRKRIVGGHEAPQNCWPWHVAIRTPLGSAHCAGTIISDRWILTAAHCLKLSTEPIFYRIVTGSDISENSIHSDRQLDDIYKHPDYEEIEEDNAAEGHAHKNDIALLKLSSSLTFDSSTRPACLPEAVFQPGHREQCWLAGRGSTGNNAGSVIRLRHVMDRVLNSTQCASHWTDGEITDDMICFGDARRGACQGDSGGGMYCQSEDSSYQVSGIISWGDINCNSRPTVLTNVSKYLTWIEETISSN